MQKIPILPLVILTISTAGMTLATKAQTQEAQLPENSTSFTGGVPTLVSADAPGVYSEANYLSPQYFFTLDLPADANQSLGQVKIQQQESPQPIEFDLDKTKGFEGTMNKQGQALKLKEVTEDTQTQTINVSFEPPVPPDTTFTISLQAQQNPSEGGIYQFTVNAFPAGDNPMGLDVGVGRLQFEQPF